MEIVVVEKAHLQSQARDRSGLRCVRDAVFVCIGDKMEGFFKDDVRLALAASIPKTYNALSHCFNVGGIKTKLIR